MRVPKVTGIEVRHEGGHEGGQVVLVFRTEHDALKFTLFTVLASDLTGPASAQLTRASSATKG